MAPKGSLVTEAYVTPRAKERGLGLETGKGRPEWVLGKQRLPCYADKFLR